MPETRSIVINATPALSAAMGSLDVLKAMVDRVIVPKEVVAELHAGGQEVMGLAEFRVANWIERRSKEAKIVPHVGNVCAMRSTGARPL